MKNNKLIYQQLIVKPTAFNCILWNANVATSEGYFLADYSLFDSQAIRFKFYSKNKILEEKLTAVSDFQKLKNISEGWYLITQQNEKLYFNDLRFGLLNEDTKSPQFAFSYEFLPNSNGSIFAVEVPKTRRDGKALMQKVFTRIKGN